MALETDCLSVAISVKGQYTAGERERERERERGRKEDRKKKIHYSSGTKFMQKKETMLGRKEDSQYESALHFTKECWLILLGL